MRCAAPHADPVALPRCNADIPDTINDIIAACRREQPSQRLPAHELLAMLPPDHSPAETDLSGSFPLILRTQGSPACDECGLFGFTTYYHCNICHKGDVDICEDCFTKGAWCFDNSHKLSRRVVRDRGPIEESLFISTRP